MKQLSLFLIIAFASLTVFAQENMVTLSGGYSWANLEEVDAKATGYRINALYEFNPQEGKVAHGVAMGFISTSASDETVSIESVEYKLTNWPIYYAPKVMFGKNKIKIFIKGAAGIHISRYKRTGYLGEVSSNDTGFYGGLGGGLIINLSEKLFLNGEYEWAWLSNYYYDNGFMNSAMGGIGLRF
jgi:hypothetical protein